MRFTCSKNTLKTREAKGPEFGFLASRVHGGRGELVLWPSRPQTDAEQLGLCAEARAEKISHPFTGDFRFKHTERSFGVVINQALWHSVNLENRFVQRCFFFFFNYLKFYETALSRLFR